VGVFGTGVNAMDPALIFLDITPRASVDQQKLARALQVLAEENRMTAGRGDPFRYRIAAFTGQLCDVTPRHDELLRRNLPIRVASDPLVESKEVNRVH
jgi:hypothetical protein